MGERCDFICLTPYESRCLGGRVAARLAQTGLRRLIGLGDHGIAPHSLSFGPAQDYHRPQSVA